MFNKLTIVVMFLSLLAVPSIWAQDITITGVVTEAVNGMPLPGVNVVLKGTNNGASTDFDGNYTLSNVPEDGILVFSIIGYATREISVNGRTSINAVLDESAEQLGEVVVTALGIKKETKALGYSLTEVGGEELSTVKQTNAINALQGKVAGVNITQNSTGAAGSSRVIIRGNSTLTGNNQPLYVVDGVPISNDSGGSAGMWGGNDGGDGISSINPDDIESVSVLKGGSASALYGSRGGNGVILITTKGGREKQGFGVELSSSVTFDQLNSSIQDFQNTYGQGIRARIPANAEEALDLGTSSWGARLDGSPVIQWDGEERPYSYVGNNMDRFYRTGTTFINTAALVGNSEHVNYRFSASNMDNKDIMPNASMNRKTFALNAGAVLAEKLTTQVNVKYIVDDVMNRPRLSDAPGNANYTVALLSPNVDVRNMQPGTNPDGTERQYSSNTFSQNPYFAAYNFRNEDLKNRIIASTSLQYDILEWLYVSGRVGVDHFTRRSTSVEPWGTAYKPLGGMNEAEWRYTQIDADVMLGMDKELTDKLGLSALVGANNNHIKSETLNLGGNDFIIPGFEDISNLGAQTRNRIYSERKIGSLYGSLELSWDDWAYLTFTGRNDWFSTLSYPGKTSPNNDFYPSVNASVILSDALDMPASINFLKLRGGYSQVAGGGDIAYQLVPNDEFFGQGHLGQPLGRISGDVVPNPDLVPWTKKEYEIGVDARFFNNRLSLDLALYKNETINDLVNASISNTTGYNFKAANLGKLENKGVEFLLSGKPFRTKNFSWTTSINGAFNESLIVNTNPEGQPVSLDEPRTQNVRIQHIVGERYGKIVGISYVRDETGNIVYDINADGVPLPQPGERKILGDGVPPWGLGWSNSFTFGNFNLNFLIDGKFGGQIFSGTNTLAYSNGLHKTTLEGRENGLEVSGIDGATGEPFTTTVAPEDLQTYYSFQNGVARIAEEFVEDADYIKFRELSIGYTLPDSILDKIFLTGANISFIARNLFYIKRSADNIDPESAYNVGNSQGLEYFGVPSTRSYGLSLNVKF
ncbi:SusC/RagA family TonB-linked outer membrane protein [Sinomicrobium weinanense]|uniref:SusC/RagA family TonB-linked outer membrane protein n=1 Tax=Sinomicrobium weinanense TaxID=2842200 RepID=A0A926JR27_9FLAO|nr:SusC/RagA family TonB-linked outer membrane protein [Sinomicrobium weinanense]MBC9795932.1 SusC/RagA family TonB-linked outer membrane protein [Sinomicrobium weinanense]MBU3124689.1 SusC/RagA family TonB-linked outer membrane protein [Sinomicrobium weinanense]